MFIKSINIKNFRIFSNEKYFEIDDLNCPDGKSEGSGLNLFVGENGCGKTALLDAFVLPLLSYKTDGFSLDDFFNTEEDSFVKIFADEDFNVSKTISGSFKSKGFLFKANVRKIDNKKYLSSIIVSDQQFIQSDNENIKEDDPNLRVNVNNPWRSKRFDENDILFLDENRRYQVRSGNFNKTRFDRLMEDFDFQYIKGDGDIIDLDESIKNILNGVDNEFLEKAVKKFEEISGQKISLGYINNWTPHNKAFFGIKKENKQHVPIERMGSGYEMVFCLLYSFYLAQQSEKQLIVFIDEPELHFHPKLQEDFVKVLLELSKTSQIFLSTHSPLFVKQTLYNERVKVGVLKRNESEIEMVKMDKMVLPYVSANEINFVAFDLPTEEYHNELYEELKIRSDDGRSAPLNIKDFDINFFQRSKSETANYPYKGELNQISIHTDIRTKIHHRGKFGTSDIKEIKRSIERMRSFF